MTRCGKIGVLLLAVGLMTIVVFSGGPGFGPDLRAYTVQGNSMQPVYEPGDLIITSTKGARSVQPGEIIVFVADWASDKYDHRVVHRVAAVGEIDGHRIAYTRGDANLIADPVPVDLAGDVRVVHYKLHAGGIWAELLIGPILLAIVATLGAGTIGAALSMAAPWVLAGARQGRRAMGRPRTQSAPATDLRFPY